MRFKFKAIKVTGETYEGIEDVKGEAELYSLLKSRGETLVSAEEETKKNKLNFLDKFLNFLTSIKEEEKISFAHNLGSMIEAGLPVARALSVISRQTKNKKFKEVVAGINQDLKKGHTLSTGLEKFPKVFPQIFVSMTHAGEESGNLANSLKIIANQLEKSHKLKKKVHGALLYPSIIVIAMIIVAILMLIFIVPTLTATFKELNVDLPASTQSIIFVSDFLKNNTLIALALFASFMVGILWFKRTKRGKKAFDWLFLKLPLIGLLVQETNSARAARTLSSLLTAGVEVIRALEITSEVVQNHYFKQVLITSQDEIQKGATMSSVFKKNEEYYPALVSEMMAVGEETGKLPDMLLRVATFYEEEVEQKTSNMSTIIEPFLMVVIGTVVGFFAISMITPMYSLSSGI